ncbi:MerR family transcriptional regulator [Ehrlichia ruminantium]|uniref:MerR family transcriptional regulator n=1 Tax=Ehrlichia ruminantium TaxID=779 RepID=A0AAE6UI96_EHRRU|nr:MerR family transcriptional regulator [Ehrlichia ruminantium]QGR02195.1 MerR family transcriptional regulator [Ehrlichia ruminantium]QGR03117.1 MerR family transcriptional regulator [Ehrlichia ruminantium]QGR04042.1 MerR family transcriptional regulator [Ehrlichia ruminantium]
MAKKGVCQNNNTRLQTISEVAKNLNVEQYVLRFWEEKFPQISPIKRRGRRLYSQVDIDTLKYIKYLLYDKGYKIKGVQQELSSVNTAAIAKDNCQQGMDTEVLTKLLNDMLDLRDSLLKKINGV